ncbi:MAG: Phosphoribosylformylglycinamidine synthase I [Candidatus Peregrinibacteria bacterium GW2011_GWA2_54_9]|nr:MAG: Phosphoribosylformylglycinamidine synthase I [Candidatus Peregrinibacteria bacterium GW2011_GWA2_54_9]
MQTPKIAVLSFPGNNCEVESIRAVRRAGMDALYFRWNDDTEKLKDVDGYFIPGGFSYEDRGRAGMVAARDPLMDFIRSEAKEGKPVIGNCNGAQILVESGLIPLGEQLQMCLARNVVGGEAVGFLNEWVFITPTCARNRCVTSDWEGVMTLPIAHGEGRFVTKDSGLIDELRKNDQIAFSYCDAQGNVSEDPVTTPNGSAFAIAGICNPAGNVVALMPHPERTEGGSPYFVSLKRWVQNKVRPTFHEISRKGSIQRRRRVYDPLFCLFILVRYTFDVD